MRRLGSLWRLKLNPEELHIQFLSISSRVCSTLLSDLTSRFGPCASLSLYLHQAVKRTFTSKLSTLLGTHKTARREFRRTLPFIS